jgi:PKD repeat protein
MQLKQKLGLGLFLGLMLSGQVYGQTDTHELACGTDAAMQKIFSEHPERKTAWLAQLNQRKLSGHQLSSFDDSVLVIPVVVHIIHNYGPENIGDAQVHDMMRIINEDFASINADTNMIDADFKPIKGISKIVFRLAQKDSAGNCTSGITRTVSELTMSADNNVKDLISWNTGQYLNIWVVNTISFGAGGYAYYPGTVDSRYEGIVCRSAQFGSIGTSDNLYGKGRTITHEIGHYLDLAHTWGSSNNSGLAENCNIDDDVEDTPNTIGVSSSLPAYERCNKNMMSCGEKNNVENFMDYSNCRRMFTEGQVWRMREALASDIGSRNTLWTLENRIATGTNNGYVSSVVCTKPRSNFRVSNQTICTGGSVVFQSQAATGGASVVYKWVFEGGTPATSQLSNPTVIYNTAGTYKATLITTNAAGSDTLVKLNYIAVNTSTAAYSASLGRKESFEEATFPVFSGNTNKNWIVENPNALSWAKGLSGYATDGQTALRIANRGLMPNTINSIISPIFNLSGLTSPAVLSFKMAYARCEDYNKDELKIFISTDCGKNWTALPFHKIASAPTLPLNTVDTLYPLAFYAPKASHWRREMIDISNYLQHNNVRFRLEMKSMGGNHLYIDEFEVMKKPVVGLETLGQQYKVNVMPNPAQNETHLSYELPKKTKVSIFLTDILGRDIWHTSQEQSAGLQTTDIPLSNLNNGIYVLRMHIDGQLFVQKILKD